MELLNNNSNKLYSPTNSNGRYFNIERNHYIFDRSVITLQDIFKSDLNFYNRINVSETLFLKYFEQYIKMPNNQSQANLIKWMKEKFRLVDFEKCIERNIVYIYTYLNKIVYIGETNNMYHDRLCLNNGKGYQGQLFGNFAYKHDFTSKNKDWKFYVYHPSLSKRKWDRKTVEAYLINWFAIKGIPILNTKSETIRNLFNNKIHIGDYGKSHEKPILEVWR